MKRALSLVLSASMLAGCLAPIDPPDVAEQEQVAEQAAAMERVDEQADEHVGETAQPFGWFAAALIALGGAAIGAAASFGASYYNLHHQPPPAPCPDCNCNCVCPPPMPCF
jgi:hypothetical protein